MVNFLNKFYNFYTVTVSKYLKQRQIICRKQLNGDSILKSSDERKIKNH
jgi:hypothetical protein